MQDSFLPLVSVGIPTYNRVSSLRKAVDSVLAQDYPKLELIISDNASTDETQKLCQQFCEQDKRVRYIRHLTNHGPNENFIEVLKQAQGDFFMWLGDDDWLDHSYVSHCAQFLLENPDYSLVSGKVLYFQNETFSYEGIKVSLFQAWGGDRVIAYYAQVTDNGTFYGLMRREQLSTVPMPNTMGGDWLLIAAIAFMGKVKTLESVCVYRTASTESSESYFKRIVWSLGLPSWYANYPHFSIAVSSFKDIVESSPYKDLKIFSRIDLAYRVFTILIARFVINPFVRLMMAKLAGVFF